MEINKVTLPDTSFVFGDVHLGRESNSLAVFHNTEKYFYSLLPKFASMKESGIPFSITFMGDTYDSSSSVNTYISSRFVTIIKKYLEYADQIIFLIGNHDTFTKHDNESNSVLALGLHERIHIITSQEYFKTQNGSVVCYLSHIADEVKLVETVESVPAEVVLYIHQEINGFVYKGKDSESALKKEHLQRFLKVINGHIHGHVEQGNILITGSMEQCNFGESASLNHSFIIGHDKSVQYGVKIEKLYNNVSPKYHRLKYSDVSDLTPQQYSEKYAGNNVRITCKNNDETEQIYGIIKNDEQTIQSRIEKELDRKTIIISDVADSDHKNLSDMIYDTAVELTKKSEIPDVQKKIVLSKLKKYHKQ
jgi:hypothetical protein